MKINIMRLEKCVNKKNFIYLFFFLLLSSTCLGLYIYSTSVTTSDNSSIEFIPILSILLIITIMGTVYMIIEKKPIEKVFIIAFLGLGFIYSLLMSPFVIPDEATHYDRAYSLSNRLTGYDDVMRREEDLILKTYAKTPNRDSVQETFDNLFSISTSNEMVESPIIHSKATKVIPYITPALGITVGKLLHLGAYPMFYLGRIFNLAIAAFMIYIAIKLIPVGKSALFVIIFFPKTMHLVCSYSYDSLVISSTMLFVAYILYLKYTKKSMEKRDYVVLTVLPVLFLSSKSFGYMSFLFLLFILPWRNLLRNQRKNVIAFIAVSSILYLYSSGTITLVKDLVFPSISNTSTEIGPYHTYSDILKDPFKYISMVITTFYRNIEFYIKDMIGDTLAWYTFPVKEIIVYLYGTLLILAGLNIKKDFKFFKRDHFILAATGIASCGIIVLSMAVGYTPRESTTIIGVQGRYFTPILILLILSLYNMRLRLENNITKGILYSVVILQIFTVVNITVNIMRI